MTLDYSQSLQHHRLLQMSELVDVLASIISCRAVFNESWFPFSLEGTVARVETMLSTITDENSLQTATFATSRRVIRSPQTHGMYVFIIDICICV